MLATVRRVGWGAPALLCSLIAAIFIFGTPARYPVVLSVVLSAVQLLAMIAATASLLIPAWRSKDDGKRQIAVIGYFC